MSLADDHMRAAAAAQKRANSRAAAHRTALEERDKYILRAHEAGATYPAIGQALGLHESRIKQILTAQRRKANT